MAVDWNYVVGYTFGAVIPVMFVLLKLALLWQLVSLLILVNRRLTYLWRHRL